MKEIGERLAVQTGQPLQHTGNDEGVAGVYHQRLTLASSRFAMIDDGLGFLLVPWTLSMKSISAAAFPASRSNQSCQQ
tara:strand:- start:23056 stop:23289 length:234 start_codon:yes stop_codon:yes gene_type:complete